MLDRLISGAGAVADTADGWTRALGQRSDGRVLGRLPGSVIVAVLLFALAGLLVLVGIEGTDGPTPRALGPGELADSDGLGQRTYATISGSLAAMLVPTYDDANGNGVQDGGEDATGWYYWLVDPVSRTGVTVHSARPPSELFTAKIRGVVDFDPDYIAQDVPWLGDATKELGLNLEKRKLIDAREHPTGSAAPMPLDGNTPRTGVLVELAGSRMIDYVDICSGDADHDQSCDEDEVDAYDIVVYDPVSKHAITVTTDLSPEFQPTTMTGLVRRDERTVDEAQTMAGLDLTDLDLHVSDHYILDEGAGPSNAPAAFGLAAAFGAVAAVILIGVAGGYLIYHRSDGHLPLAAASLAPGERLPLRITGIVRTTATTVRVREAPGALVRTMPDEPIDTSLMVERLGRTDGVPVGLGQLDRLSSGQVFPLRGVRPALRLGLVGGPLVVSFETEAERDRAAAELLDETGLGPDGKHIATI